jgi:predicted transcriptional regulator
MSFLKEEININEYPTHKIKIYIKGLEDNESISTQAFNFLSNNSYFNELKETALKSYKVRLAENKVIRAQIDSIIREQKDNAVPKLDNNAISFTGSQDLQELLSQKKDLLDDDLTLRNQLSTNSEILKTIDSTFGVLSKDRNLSPITIPLSIVGIYILFFFFKYSKKRVSRIIN